METPQLWIQETYVNEDRHGICGETEPYETRYSTDEVGRLFRFLQREYGRCSGRQYVDRKDGPAVQTGWVFEKRARYTDCAETYLQRTWVTVWSTAPQHVPEHWTGGAYAFAAN